MLNSNSYAGKSNNSSARSSSSGQKRRPQLPPGRRPHSTQMTSVFDNSIESQASNETTQTHKVAMRDLLPPTLFSGGLVGSQKSQLEK